jgi:hypothetical protein
VAESPPYVAVLAVLALIITAMLWVPVNSGVVEIVNDGDGGWGSGSEEAQQSQTWMLWTWNAIGLVIMLGALLKMWQVSKRGGPA